MSTTSEAIEGRERAVMRRISKAARSKRLDQARRRREELRPRGERERDQRIDGGVADVVFAWEQRAELLREVEVIERVAADAVNRLRSDRVTLDRIAQLTGLDRPTIRRLRSLRPDEVEGDTR